MLEDVCDLSDISDNLFSEDFIKSSALEEPIELPTICGICEKPFVNPVILTCLHVYDRDCLQNFEKHDALVFFIKCPRCDTLSGGIKTLETYDASIAQTQESASQAFDIKVVKCSVCTDGNEALYKCLHCAGTLCERCRDIHKVMKVFSNHEILDLTDVEKHDISILQRNMQNAKLVVCTTHTDFMFTSFCMQCHIPLCEACFDSDHKGHITIRLDRVSENVDALLFEMIENCQSKQKEFRDSMDSMHNLLSELSSSRDANKAQINEHCKQWINGVESVKEYFIRKNREIHDELEMKIWSRIHGVDKTIDHIDFACEFVNSYLKKCSNIEMCKLTKNVLACFDKLTKVPLLDDQSVKVKFVPDISIVHDIVRQYFGSFKLPNSSDSDVCQSPKLMLQKFTTSTSHINSLSGAGDLSDDLKRLAININGHMVPQSIAVLDGTTSITSMGHDTSNSLRVRPLSSLHIGNGTLENYMPQSANSVLNHRNNWNDIGVHLPNIDPSDFMANVTQVDNSIYSTPYLSGEMNQNLVHSTNSRLVNMLDVDSNLMKQKLGGNYNVNFYEYSRIRASRSSQMNLLTKWGSLGCELGRLNSPHGFCLGFEEEIVVADTYNHRIQIFTKRGDFVSFFGVSGRVDGLLWYPRKVAIIRQSQRYVVCDRGNERSRMQLFSRSGHFVRRIPIRYIDIVAGLAINHHGHIVAIDSVSPSVFVVSEEGDLIRWFDCSNHMREPSDVAIHGRECYICDFKAHCVIVFQEDGTFIRRIGGESITDFPNGIDVSDHGDVLVGDSHGNRFHIAVFSRTGEMLSEFVCNQTKVSRSCCLKITTEGYVVTLARSSNNVLVLDTLYIS